MDRTAAGEAVPSPSSPMPSLTGSQARVYERSRTSYLTGTIGIGVAGGGLIIAWSTDVPASAGFRLLTVSIISAVFVVRASSLDRSFRIGIDLAVIALFLPTTPLEQLIPLWVVGTLLGRWISHGDYRIAWLAAIGEVFAGLVFAVSLTTLTPVLIGQPPYGPGTQGEWTWWVATALALIPAALTWLTLSCLRLRLVFGTPVRHALRAVGWSRFVAILGLIITEVAFGGSLSSSLSRAFPQVDSMIGQEAIIALVALSAFGIVGVVRTDAAWRHADAIARALSSLLRTTSPPVIEQQLKGFIAEAMFPFAVAVVVTQVNDEDGGGPQATTPRRTHDIRGSEDGSRLVSARIPAWFGDLQVLVTRKTWQRPFNRSDAAMLEALASIAGQKLETLRTVNQLADQANTDPLTGLLNYRGLRGALKQIDTDRFRRQDDTAVLIFMDLDDFKGINDTYGHEIGNAVLAEVAARIESVIRKPDAAARIGGDEFVVVLHGPSTLDEARPVAQRLADAISQPVRVGDLTITVGVSNGMAFSSDARTQADALLALADQRMYAAKAQKNGLSEVRSAKVGAHPADEETCQRISRIRQLIESGETRVFYQPIVDTHHGRVIGLEALVRPEVGTSDCSAEELVSVAHDFGLFDRLTQDIFTTAITDFAELRAQFPDLAELYLNVDADQMLSKSFFSDFDRLDTGQFPIVLEVNEKWTPDWSEESTVRLREQVCSHDLRLAIDDVGRARFSILAMLKLPVRVMKIDKSVIDEYASARATPVVSGLVSTADLTDIRVIFEGVETEDQLRFVHDCGGRLVQGFYYAPPLPREDLTEFLSRPVEPIFSSPFPPEPAKDRRPDSSSQRDCGDS